jgi:hypothetical protein
LDTTDGDERNDPVLRGAMNAMRDRDLPVIEARTRLELAEHVWGILSASVSTLAVLQDETPREICEQAFTAALSGEEWDELRRKVLG